MHNNNNQQKWNSRTERELKLNDENWNLPGRREVQQSRRHSHHPQSLPWLLNVGEEGKTWIEASLNRKGRNRRQAVGLVRFLLGLNKQESCRRFEAAMKGQACPVRFQLLVLNKQEHCKRSRAATKGPGSSPVRFQLLALNRQESCKRCRVAIKNIKTGTKKKPSQRIHLGLRCLRQRSFRWKETPFNKSKISILVQISTTIQMSSQNFRKRRWP
mmetsp:Transcript_19196/g.45233  ORF Transcript_19196/g.45233 Transcript_19196/m.45233 type:complete len:215 (+) Transcript_19196:670-1314(+)